jgi:steroid delta-isomerase-like uncharacterized protein
MSNKQVVIEFYRLAFNEKQPQQACELLAENFIHNGEIKGRDGQKQVVQYFLNAFPNMEHSIDLIFGEEDYVTARQTWKGTHEGEFGGVDPTNRVITFNSTAILKISDGKIDEAIDCYDMYDIYKQMGDIPI